MLQNNQRKHTVTDRAEMKPVRSKDKELMKKIRSYVDEYALENIGRTPSTRKIVKSSG